MDITFQGAISNTILILERMKTASALESYDLLVEARESLNTAESALDHHIETWEKIYKQVKIL